MGYARYYEQVTFLLSDGPVQAAVLREVLNEPLSWWWRWSRPGFYLLMRRMEEDGLVRCFVKINSVETPCGWINVPMRVYSLTDRAKGVRVGRSCDGP